MTQVKSGSAVDVASEDESAAGVTTPSAAHRIDPVKEKLANDAAEKAGVLQGGLAHYAEPIFQRIVDAESRRLALQTEAAINLAVGLAVHLVGNGKVDSLTVTAQDIRAFSSKYRVESAIASDSRSHTYTIKER